MIEYGVANWEVKGEDVPAVKHAADGRSSVFAVFDGHGGVDGASACEKGLAPELLTLCNDDERVGHDRFPNEAIIDSFWDQDRELGARGIYAGTTAVVLMVTGKETAKVGQSSSLACTLAWVGDSVGVWFDMTSPDARAPVIGLTRSHLPTDELEQQRLDVEWKVRSQVESSRHDASLAGGNVWLEMAEEADNANGKSTQPQPGMPPTSQQQQGGQDQEKQGKEQEQDGDSWRLLGLQRFFKSSQSKEGEGFKEGKQSVPDGQSRRPSREESMRLRAESFYAVKRAPTTHEVEDALRRLGIQQDAEQVRVLIRALGREKRIEAPERRRSLLAGSPMKLERQNSRVLERVSVLDSSVHGPLVIHGGVRAEVTTMMTRSIGDWDGSRAMIPHPDLSRFEVEAGQWQRVILASDGLWDFVTPEEAVKIARREKSPEGAAQRLVAQAYRRSNQKVGYMKDDTTCICIDLNPSQLPFSPPTVGMETGCCSMM